MKSYQIYLMRHGITEGNLHGQYIGSTDLPLCAEGREGLAELDAKYNYPGAGAYITSPMKRCTETLSLLYPQATQIPVEDLRECDFGLFEGMTAEELKKAPSFKEWIGGGEDASPPDGESSGHFAQRVCAAFEAIVNGLVKTGTTPCIICAHGGVISLLLSRYGLPRAEPTDWPCEPGCGYAVRIHPQLWMNGQVMEVYSRFPFEREPEEDEQD